MARAKKTKTDEMEVKKPKKGLPQIGDVVELSKDHHSMCFDLYAGDKVLVTDETAKGYSINSNPKHPEDGFEMTECGLEL